MNQTIKKCVTFFEENIAPVTWLFVSTFQHLRQDEYVDGCMLFYATWVLIRHWWKIILNDAYTTAIKIRSNIPCTDGKNVSTQKNGKYISNAEFWSRHLGFGMQLITRLNSKWLPQGCIHGTKYASAGFSNLRRKLT